MRQSFRERREHLHRGLRVPRLTTMILMLGILGLVFVQLHNPNNWRIFASHDENSQVAPDTVSARTTSASPEAKPEGSGARSTGSSRKAEEKPPKGESAKTEPPKVANPSAGTDLDPKEMEKIKPLLDLFYDGSMESMPLEQPAYFQVLSWVDHQSTDALRKRAMRAFVYDTLVKRPDTMRLQIVEVKLAVRQIVPVMGKPKDGRPQPMRTRDGKEIYEVRGISQESGSNFYFGIVTDLPPGTPLGTLVNEDATLVGYFFKVQGYYSKQQELDFEANQTKRIVPLKAPLIIGRLVWVTQPTATAAAKPPLLLLASVGGVAIVLIVAWVYWSSRQRPHAAVPRITTMSPIDPDAVPVDSWLDQAQSGRFTGEPLPEMAYSEGPVLDLDELGGRYLGNIFGEKRESNSGDHSSNGHSSTEGTRSNNQSTGPEPEIGENDDPGTS